MPLPSIAETIGRERLTRLWGWSWPPHVTINMIQDFERVINNEPVAHAFSNVMLPLLLLQDLMISHESKLYPDARMYCSERIQELRHQMCS